MPQARTDLLSDASLSKKMEDVGIRMFCVYFCFLFVYYAVFRSKGKSTDLPDEGAYGGYEDTEAK